MEFMLIAVILSCDFYNFRDPYARIIIKPCLIVTVMYTIIKQQPRISVQFCIWKLLNTEMRNYN